MAPGAVDRLSLTQDVTDFLYHEAELLDQNRYHEWLELFADDVRYVVPIHEAVQGGPDGAEQNELAYHLFDEDKGALEMRVKRLDTGLAHVETPPSITQRLISNVRVLSVDGDTVEVGSNFLVYQVRHDIQESYFIGRREDRLRGSPGSWQIVQRKILLAQPVMPRA
ncbi:MAG TPA: aromatic-ring-hydroxylating dioxygenase subunit beta, partial [Chloroflexota bacterium]|nr:aromatic-ring-hydroxylating dioxygenase subunit beta [Chloroflexota bacterium]